MPASFCNLLACLVHCEGSPFRGHKKVPRYLEQLIQDQGASLNDSLFHGENADGVVSDAKVITLGFDVGIDHLVIEKLCALRLPCYAPVVVIEQAAKEP